MEIIFENKETFFLIVLRDFGRIFVRAVKGENR